MREVLKWRVPVTFGQVVSIPLPYRSKLLHVGAQTPHAVELWTESLVAEPQQSDTELMVVGTGDKVPDGWHHLGTGLYDGGKLVWHLYILLKGRPGELRS